MADDIVPAAARRKQRRERRRQKRQPMKATAEALTRSAQRYLERYDTASGHLRRLLLAKVTLSARLHGTDADEGAAVVEGLVRRFLDAGVLNDQRFAQARVRSLRAKGCSAAMIRSRLAAKGVPRDLIDQALEAAEGTDQERDLAAALTYARRRRLGPFRPEGREEQRARDLAALGRRGFGYQTAQRVIDCEDPAQLLAELALD